GCYGGRGNVAAGDGEGSFPAPNTTAPGAGYHTAGGVGDRNGGGNQDLATANGDNWTVSVLMGDGSGNLGGPTEYYAGGSAGSVAVGDVNGDSHPDLVTANRYSDNVGVLLGDGAGAFRAPQTYPVRSTPS